MDTEIVSAEAGTNSYKNHGYNPCCCHPHPLRSLAIIGALLASMVDNGPPLRGLFLHQHRSGLADILYLLLVSRGSPTNEHVPPGPTCGPGGRGTTSSWGPASPHCGTMWMSFFRLEKLEWNFKFGLIGLTCVFAMSHEGIRRVSEGSGCKLRKGPLKTGPIIDSSDGDPRGAAFLKTRNDSLW